MTLLVMILLHGICNHEESPRYILLNYFVYDMFIQF